MESNNSFLVVKKLAKFFSLPDGSSQNLFSDLNLTIARGEIVAIVGPSGCGKTTFLRIVAGLERESSGIVTFVSGRPKHIGYATQDDTLLPWRSGRDQVLSAARISNPSATPDIGAIVTIAGLTIAIAKWPAQMSGGMKQRVNVCRAMALEAPLVLLDEPLSQVDYAARDSLLEGLHRWLKQRDTTALIVTHEIADAIAFADRLLLYNSGTKTFDPIGLGRLSSLNPEQRRKSSLFTEHLTAILNEIRRRGA